MNRRIIDANVPMLAGTNPADMDPDQAGCAQKCVRYIKEFIEDVESRLVLDDEGRILKEYRNAETIREEPNLAKIFYLWAYQNQAADIEDFVHLDEKQNDEFDPYPADKELSEFDPPDRKYIALAYKHEKKPPIVEASDSKWWGIRDNLKKFGIDVEFIDEEYIKNKYKQKIGL